MAIGLLVPLALSLIVTDRRSFLGVGKTFDWNYRKFPFKLFLLLIATFDEIFTAF